MLSDAGKKIEHLLKEKGLSREQLADIIGVSRQAIAKWEDGQCIPSSQSIASLCKCFDLRMEDFYGENTAETPAAIEEPCLAETPTEEAEGQERKPTNNPLIKFWRKAKAGVCEKVTKSRPFVACKNKLTNSRFFIACKNKLTREFFHKFCKIFSITYQAVMLAVIVLLFVGCCLMEFDGDWVVVTLIVFFIFFVIQSVVAVIKEIIALRRNRKKYKKPPFAWRDGPCVF